MTPHFFNFVDSRLAGVSLSATYFSQKAKVGKKGFHNFGK